MNTYALLAIKITLTTVAFLVLLFLAILATTLIFQDSGQHPDNWKTTGYDYGAGILVAALYIATVIWQIRSALKKKAVQRQQEHNNALKALTPFAGTGEAGPLA